MSTDSKEFLYEKIVHISEQKGKIIEENSSLIKENEELKKKINELNDKIKILESGVSIESIVEFIDKIKEKVITEIKVIGEENVQRGTQE